MKSLIISGGDFKADFIEKYIADIKFEYIIAADNGLSTCKSIGLIPTHIIGDFDSLDSPETLLLYENSSEIIRLNPQKDFTDTHQAMILALDLNSLEIHIVGACGSRLDHTLANIHILKDALNHRVSAFLVDPNNKIYLLGANNTLKIFKSNQYGKYISVLPLGDKITGVELIGLKYPLKNAVINSGESIGISNEIIDEYAIISIKSGIAIIFETKD